MRLFLIVLLLVAIDLYVFQGVKTLTHHRLPQTQKIIHIVYWSITILCIGIILTGQLIDWHSWPKALRTYSIAMIVIIYLSKIFVVVFLLLDDIIRLFRWIYVLVAGSQVQSSAGDGYRISRLGFLVKTGFAIGAIPFISMIYGMIGGAYNFRVRKVAMKFPDLPDAFNGLRIIQLSDIHTGSYMSPHHLEEAIDLAMKQKPDVIFFTGDLVNDLHTEALPFREILGKLKAPMGVYSILGNHDYGDYFKWPDEISKKENLDKLKSFERELGWKLLLNEHTYLERDGQKIGLIGVENYGARGFSRYGNMTAATENYEKQSVNILLSHDPSHWNMEITNEHQYVDLTLSGHTHGMQFGIDIPGFRWSPVKYFYNQWADLYKEGNQYIYVNRGLGFIGYPGRVGILPEITLLEFKKG